MIKGAVRSIRYFSGPFLKRLITGNPTPTLAGYKITHRCNLKCVHCPYWKRNGDELDFSYRLNFAGSTQYQAVETLSPVPEPGALA